MEEGIFWAGTEGWLGVGETKREGMKAENGERIGGRKGYTESRDKGYGFKSSQAYL